MEIVYKKNFANPPRVSFILLDWSCRESFHMFRYLDQQTLPRDQYEIIWIEFYHRRSPDLSAMIKEYEEAGKRPPLDQWIVLDIPENSYYHKHLMYNIGIVAARGGIVTICDSDVMVRPSFVESIIHAFDADKNRDYDPQKGIVLHLDEVRSSNRAYYPFNHPTFEEIESGPCINWKNNTTTGLLEKEDPLHVLNYGACMCALREDLIAIGGADEHRDYLGHVCGPYEMTFRLVNAGKKEVWHPSEFLYHTWHPGTDGYNNFIGPNDGKNMSTTSLEARENKRIFPLDENPAIRILRLRESQSTAESLLPLAIREEIVKSWTISEAQMLTSLGKGAFNRADYDEALRCWNKALELIPDEKSIQGNLGWAYYHKDNYLEAMKAFNVALEANPINTGALNGRGWTSLQDMRYEDAVRDFSEALQSGLLQGKPSFQEAHRGRGWAYYHSGRFDAAVEDFFAALNNTDPKDTDVLRNESLGLFLACANNGDDLDHAVARFKILLGNLAQPIRSAIENALQGKEHAGNLKETLLSELGWVHYLKRSYKEALAVFDAALTIDSALVRALCGRGWTLLQIKRYDEAVGDFNQALVECSDNSGLEEILRGRGFAFYHKGLFKQAIDDFTKAIANTKPKDVASLREALLGRGLTLYEVRRYGEALADFNQAFKNLQDSTKGAEKRRQVSLLRAKAHYCLGMEKEALEDFRQAKNLPTAHPLLVKIRLMFTVHGSAIKQWLKRFFG